MANIPDFDDLPAVPGMPQGCAWGVFDQDGKKDLFGTLNLLTPGVIKAASTEIRRGISVSLNWPIGSIKFADFFRKSLSHRVLELKNPVTGEHVGYDDEVEFNTQSSSQWDGLCHCHHLPSKLAYNGFKPSVEAMERPDPENPLPTLNHWHDRGCITGRGVLIDFKAYADAKGIEYSPFSDFRITTADIESVAKHQGTAFRHGDILILRFGFTEALGRMTGDEQRAAIFGTRWCGIEGSEETARWLWNNHFAAIASDNMAVEAVPPIVGGEEKSPTDLVLHIWCLSLFGMPLGELWDLKRLSEECRKGGQYSFFLTSSPLNVPGSVGSPPNAVAVL